MISRQTNRLTLREFQEDDWNALQEYCADERLCYYLNWGPNTESQTRDFVRRVMLHQRQVPRAEYNFVIINTESKEVVGHCRIRIMLHRHLIGEFHVIIRRKDWGKGYGAEGIRSLLDFGFNELKLHRIFCMLDPEDATSARVLEKCGFEREGHLREHEWIKGMWRDSLVYGILDYEWESLRNRPPAEPLGAEA